MLCSDDNNLPSQKDYPVRFSFFAYTFHVHILYVWLYWSNAVFFHFKDINIWKKTTKMGPPIGIPTIWFLSLLLTENTHFWVNFHRNFLNIDFFTKWLNFSTNINSVYNITYRFLDKNTCKQHFNIVRNIFIRFIISTAFQ